MKQRVLFLSFVVAVLLIACVSKTISVPQGPIEFDSVKRLQINQSFPNAENVQQALAERGYPWGDDWFGPQEVEMWVISVGADIDVKTVQNILSVCYTIGSKNIGFTIMQENEGFENRRRVYIGTLAVDTEKVIKEAELEEFLKAELTQEQYQNYGN